MSLMSPALAGGSIPLSHQGSHIFSEQTLTLGDPKYHCNSPVRERVFGNQVINKVLPQVHLTLGSLGPQTYLLVLSPVLNCIVAIEILSNCQNHSTGFLIYEVRATMLEMSSGCTRRAFT